MAGVLSGDLAALYAGLYKHSDESESHLFDAPCPLLYRKED
jgi:hypothetical protein